MRLLLVLAATLLLPLAAAGAQPPGEGERYIPAGALPAREDADGYEAWAGVTLRAMGEPVLLARPLPSGVRRRFRLLVAVNHRGSTALRIDQRRTGGAEVRVVRVDGRWPPRVVHTRAYELDRDAVLELERAVALSGVRSMAAEASEFAPDDAETRDICVPYDRYFLELVDERGSRFVTRDACEATPPLRRLIEAVMPLSARR